MIVQELEDRSRASAARAASLESDLVVTPEFARQLSDSDHQLAALDEQNESLEEDLDAEDLQPEDVESMIGQRAVAHEAKEKEADEQRRAAMERQRLKEEEAEAAAG